MKQPLPPIPTYSPNIPPPIEPPSQPTANLSSTIQPSHKYIKKQGWKKCKNRIIRVGTYDCWANAHMAQQTLLDKRMRWIAMTIINENLDIVALQRVSLPLLHYLLNQPGIYKRYYASSVKQPWKAMLSKGVHYQGMEPNHWPIILTQFEPFTTHHLKSPHSPHCIATIVDIGFTTLVNVDLDTSTVDKNKTIECFNGIQAHVGQHFNLNKVCYLGHFNFDLSGSSQMYPEKKIIKHLQDAWLKCQENITGLCVDTNPKVLNLSNTDRFDRTDGTLGYTADSYDNTLLFNHYGQHHQSRKHAILLNHSTLVALKIKRFGTDAVFTIDAEHFKTAHKTLLSRTTKHGRVVEYYPSIYFGIVCTMKY